MQFVGPQHTPNAPFAAGVLLRRPGQLHRLLAAVARRVARRRAGWPPAPTEYNTYLGLPLLLVAACVAWSLWRAALARSIVASAVTGAASWR